MKPPQRVFAFGYASEDARLDLPIAAQRLWIEDEVTRRGWRLLMMFDDEHHEDHVGSGRRAPPHFLMEHFLNTGVGNALVMTRLDVIRTPSDQASLLRSQRRVGWTLVLLDTDSISAKR